MKNKFDTYIPEGFSTVSVYLFVADPEGYIRFLEEAFEAEELLRTPSPDGKGIANSILRIGQSCFMISQARGQFEGMRASQYLYVADVDHFYRRALQAGAQSEFEPADMDYGDRQAGVVDPNGNYWWISTRLTAENYW